MSGQATDLQLIEVGNSADSYLVHKISGSQADAGGVGNIMPPNGDPLSVEQITMISDWIDAGATP